MKNKNLIWIVLILAYTANAKVLNICKKDYTDKWRTYSIWTVSRCDSLCEVSFRDTLLLSTFRQEIAPVINHFDKKQNKEKVPHNLFVLSHGRSDCDTILVVEDLGHSLGEEADKIKFTGYIDDGCFRYIVSEDVCKLLCYNSQKGTLTLKHKYSYNNDALKVYHPFYWLITHPDKDCYTVSGSTIPYKNVKRAVFRIQFSQ